MKYKMNSFLIIPFLIVAFYKAIVTAQPLDYDTATNLLPVEPQDVNETIAAVVIDPVVKDAVKHVANNGSLNGLMVRRKVVVMPVNNPQTIISERNQVLTVPPEHLEDVRQNITNSTEEESQVNEFALAEKIPLFGGYGYVNESNLHSSQNTPEVLEFNNDSYEDMQNSNLLTANSQPTAETSQLPFIPKTTATDQNLKTATVPIVAVIDPKNSNNGKSQTPIVAILPNPVEGEILKTEVHFLNKNQEQIQKEAQARIEQNAIVISSENWRSMSTLPETVQTSQAIEDAKVFLTTLLPNPEIVPSVIVETDKFVDYADDMDVAEDIIFRPLFRYRQEAAQRARYREEENSYRRTNYQRRKPYDGQDYYPRRNYRYRPQYNYGDYE